MAKIVILGAGMMGTALCAPLADNGHDIRLVGTHLDESIIDTVAAEGRHPKLDWRVPPGVTPFHHGQLEQAMDGADGVIVGVSSAGVRWAGEALSRRVDSQMPIISVTKGLQAGAGLAILPDVLASVLADGGVACRAPGAIAGPCIAGEIARRVETCVVFTGRDRTALQQFRGWLRTDYYHVFISDDVVGVEACAALKNAYAMGIAFAAGLHAARGGAQGSVAMHNFESAVFAQSAREMQLVVRALGGEAATAVGLAGVGDLDVTTNGGRTGRFGTWLGRGLSVDEAVEKMDGATLECLDIIAALMDGLPTLSAAGVSKSDLPLLMHMADVVQNGAPVSVPFDAFFGGADG